MHAPTWKIPRYMKGFLFICTSHEAFGFCAICDSLMPCTVQFCRKKWIFNGIFQVGACPNLKDSLISEYFSLHTYKTYRVRYLHFFALSATPWCFARYIILEKDDFFHEIFQVGACPNLKDPFLYDRYSIHMYKAWNIFPLSATPLCPVRYIFWKKMNF